MDFLFDDVCELDTIIENASVEESDGKCNDEEFSVFDTGALDRAAVTRISIETYYRELFEGQRQRKKRALRVEKIRSDEPQRRRLRELLRCRETQHLRLRRIRWKRSDFRFLRIINTNDRKRIDAVECRIDGKVYAMKTVQKKTMEIDELKILSELQLYRDSDALYDNNPWITRLHFAFQDEQHLYLITDIHTANGDMIGLLMRKDTLTEDETRFYIAELVLALHSVHELGYIYRNVSPAHILFDDSGHVQLSKFELSCGPKTPSMKLNELLQAGCHVANIELEQDAVDFAIRAKGSFGTVSYMAPEFFQEGYEYGQSVDWWGVGIIMFEMLYGYTPFDQEKILETVEQILNYKESLVFPSDIRVSSEAIHLMQMLICDANTRLGSGARGAFDIMAHPFFKGVDWEHLRSQKPPFDSPKLNLYGSCWDDGETENAKDVHVLPRLRSLVGFAHTAFDHSGLLIVEDTVAQKLLRNRRRCRLSCAWLIAARKHKASLSWIPRDLMRMIAWHLWYTRKDEEWDAEA